MFAIVDVLGSGMQLQDSIVILAFPSSGYGGQVKIQQRRWLQGT
jgi:hypothetical protein